MPKLFALPIKGKPLDIEDKERIAREDTAAKNGDLHPVEIKKIIEKRDELKRSGYAVPALPIPREHVQSMPKLGK